MKKLSLVGLLRDKERILDAVVSTGSLQLEETAELAYSQKDSLDCERLSIQLARISEAISTIKSETQKHNLGKSSELKKIQIPKRSILRPLFEMSFESFNALGSSYDEIFEKIEHIEASYKHLAFCDAQKTRTLKEIDELSIYSKLIHPFDYYKDTETTSIMLGVVPSSKLNSVKDAVQAAEVAQLEVIDSTTIALIAIAAHKSVAKELNESLMSVGFERPNFNIQILPSLRIEELKSTLIGLEAAIKTNRANIAGYASEIPMLEVFYDYVELQLKKVTAAGNFLTTEKTFIIKGFYPEKNEELIKSAISNATEYCLTYYDEVSETDDVPVLYQNNKFFQSFETVTDMYTPPSYHEIDPNPVMSFFYIMIFGLMVADMGYGLLLCIMGLFSVLYIKQETGIKRLGKLFGLCGIGAIAVGALYGSAFSVTLYSGLIPDAASYPKTTMILCILFGILHLIAGILMNFAKELKRKNYVSAYGVSLAWAFFFVGMFMLVLKPAIAFMDYPKFAEATLPALLSTIGLIIVGTSLLSAMLCSGHGKNIGGRLISAFTSLYGILNYFSDAMSYIRIFGLMLSSAMMGVVINMLAGMVFSSGVAGIVAGIFLLIFAHSFNLIIGVLGVYIHDGRLQYMEFFGKFYEGDGKLFLPFGHNMKYTLLTK